VEKEEWKEGRTEGMDVKKEGRERKRKEGEGERRGKGKGRKEGRHTFISSGAT
jgi:hypothetical protein